MILFSNKNSSHGKIIIDTGFTKIYPQFWELSDAP
jgi:hypothetical protein